MTSSPMEQAESRRVGSVEYVSPSEIKVLLELESPDKTALNAGTPRSFPRVNGYVLIPSDEGFTVGQIEWLGIERAPFPKRKGFHDFGVVDLPFPQRKLSLNPVGTLVPVEYLKSEESEENQRSRFRLKRGVHAFPTVGEAVLLPTDEQLHGIVESGQNRRVLIGHAPLAGNAEVKIDPNRLFGRHLAVLGNTGSGKSCSVAGLIQWSLAEARKDLGTAGGNCDRTTPNARFIVLDPNGEYSKTFRNENVRIYRFEETKTQGNQCHPLKTPAWLWNGDEWAAFSGAAPGVQRPILYEAIRRMRSGDLVPNSFQSRVLGSIRRYHARLTGVILNCEHMGQGRREGGAEVLINIKNDFEALANQCENDEALRQNLQGIAKNADEIEDSKRSNQKKDGSFWHNDFSEGQLTSLVEKFSNLASTLDISLDTELTSEDTPIEFDIEQIPDFVQAIAQGSGGQNIAQFIETLNIRIRSLTRRKELSPLLNPKETITLSQWLHDYIGESNAENGTVSIIDLSLVSTEVLAIIISLIARITFESLQRYRKKEFSTLPSVLVLEEAHHFIHRNLGDDNASPTERTCLRTFERIAREGRKFGLGLVLSSQRPSELSPTVLSQCNSFLLHRISNDRDQDTVGKLLPDHLRGVLGELPVLPTRHAYLLGWAAELPTLVEMRELSKEDQPQSHDPDFWEVWTGKKIDENGNEVPVERTVDWEEIAGEWQQRNDRPSGNGEDVHVNGDTPSSTEELDDETKEDEDEIPF